MGFIPYHEPSDVLTRIFTQNNMGEDEVGKRGIIPVLSHAYSSNKKDGISPEIFFDVHGSITFSQYSEKSDYPIKLDGEFFWYGFDCAHYNDTEEGGRSLDYCIKECKSLAKQLKKVDSFQD